MNVDTSSLPGIVDDIDDEGRVLATSKNLLHVDHGRVAGLQIREVDKLAYMMV